MWVLEKLISFHVQTRLIKIQNKYVYDEPNLVLLYWCFVFCLLVWSGYAQEIQTIPLEMNKKFKCFYQQFTISFYNVSVYDGLIKRNQINLLTLSIVLVAFVVYGQWFSMYHSPMYFLAFAVHRTDDDLREENIGKLKLSNPKRIWSAQYRLVKDIWNWHLFINMPTHVHFDIVWCNYECHL